MLDANQTYSKSIYAHDFRFAKDDIELNNKQQLIESVNKAIDSANVNDDQRIPSHIIKSKSYWERLYSHDRKYSNT